MAFEALAAHQDAILAARANGKTLTQVQSLLESAHGVKTTAGTLSRYLKTAAPDAAPREATQTEEIQLDHVALLTEILAEVQGRSEEQRLVIEHLAGKVAVSGAQVQELEKAVAALSGVPTGAPGSNGLTAGLVSKIWGRAFMLTGLFWALAVSGVFALYYFFGDLISGVSTNLLV